MLRRYRKSLTVALLMLNLGGARVVAVSDACEHNRVFFGPALSIKAIAKTITHQAWKQPAPHSFGARTDRFSAQDMEFLQNKTQMATVAILPPLNITLGTERSRNRPLYVWRLPHDKSPGQSPQLLSKK